MQIPFLKTAGAKPYAYALIQAPEEPSSQLGLPEVPDAPTPDSFALVLPATACPLDIDEENIRVPVQLVDGVATWVDGQESKFQIGEVDKPLEDKVQQALRSPQGLLVLFVDIADGSPGYWAIFTATTTH